MVKMRCVGSALAPRVSGSVRRIACPGRMANSSRSTAASAYVLPAPVPSSSSSRSTKSAGLGSYVPDLGLTNMVHASESCSSHCASPRCDLAVLVCACLLPRFQTTWSALVPGRTLYALWTVTSNRYLSAFHPATLLSMPSTIAAAPAHASLASAPGAGKGRRGGRLRDCSRACDARDCLSRGRRCSSRCATGKAVTHRASRARCGAGAEARGQDVQLSRACHRHGGIRAGG